MSLPHAFFQYLTSYSVIGSFWCLISSLNAICAVISSNIPNTITTNSTICEVLKHTSVFKSDYFVHFNNICVIPLSSFAGSLINLKLYQAQCRDMTYQPQKQLNNEVV